MTWCTHTHSVICSLNFYGGFSGSTFIVIYKWIVLELMLWGRIQEQVDTSGLDTGPAKLPESPVWVFWKRVTAQHRNEISAGSVGERLDSRVKWESWCSMEKPLSSHCCWNMILELDMPFPQSEVLAWLCPNLPAHLSLSKNLQKFIRQYTNKYRCRMWRKPLNTQ